MGLIRTPVKPWDWNALNSVVLWCLLVFVFSLSGFGLYRQHRLELRILVLEEQLLTQKTLKLEEVVQPGEILRRETRDAECICPAVSDTLDGILAPDTEEIIATEESENQPAKATETELSGETEQSDSIEKESQPTETTENEILEILGVDPTSTVQYGKDIHPELATRLQHYAIMGLTKESRKELVERYLVPFNCVQLGAPALNAEIKAAIPENILKRDKNIEARQKQLSAAISGVAGLLTKELENKDKDNSKLKELMDICRILCDIQHLESKTRRNFAMYSVKKELKEHLTNTKIDKWLFGENLGETLKTAKAVNKSGTELKTKPTPKPRQQANNLNWKSPAPARKQQSTQRGRDAAPPPAPGPPAKSNRPVTHASSWKQSRQPPKQTHRR